MANAVTGIVSDQPPKPVEYLPFLEEPAEVLSEIVDCSFDLVVALAAKGFVILTGQSGTGKSRSAIRLGRGFDGLEAYEGGFRGSSFELVPVGADWTDARPLLGYTNRFGAPRKRTDGELTHRSYEIPKALRLILRAASPSNASVPYVLVLDEMNLSHVERYFSPFLSLLEANRSSSNDMSIPLLTSDVVALIEEVLAESEPNGPEANAAQELVAGGSGLAVPQNMLIVGTVNVDETTYMFSPKVLDRAHVIELNSISPAEYFQGKEAESSNLPIRKSLELLSWSIAARKSGILDSHPREVLDEMKRLLKGADTRIEAIASATEKLLNGAYMLLDPIGFGFGFRTINEVCGYLLCWVKARTFIAESQDVLDGWQQALDQVFLQKVLPKIHGNRRQLGESLLALDAFLAGGNENTKPPAKYRLGGDLVGISEQDQLDLGSEKQMTKSRLKLQSMQVQLQATGYATFIR